MSEQSIQERVIELIADELGVDDESTLTPETQLDTLGDSLDLAELLYRAEEEFDIEVLDEDQEKLTTVGELTVYIENRATD
jgi:acyl carrier protein